MTSAEAPDERSLRSFRETHVGRLFAELHRDFSARVRAALAAAGHPGVTPGHIQVFTSLPLEGARLSDLAAHAGITAQSLGARVTELEVLGYVERVPDPGDRRATLIRFSPKGGRFLAAARATIATIEAHYEAKLGARRYRVTKGALARLVASLDIDIPS